MNEKIPEEFWEILIERYKRMPKNIKIVIGGFGEIDRNVAIKALKERSELGLLLAKLELNYLRLFKEEIQ